MEGSKFNCPYCNVELNLSDYIADVIYEDEQEDIFCTECKKEIDVYVELICNLTVSKRD